MEKETIRPAGMADIDALVQCRIRQLNDEEEHPEAEISTQLKAWFTEMLKEGKLYQIIIARDEEIIATGGLIDLPLPASFFEPGGKCGYFLNVYTAEAYRHQGYAARILSLLQEEARRRKYDVVYLSSSIHARKAYENCGFATSGDWMNWYPE